MDLPGRIYLQSAFLSSQVLCKSSLFQRIEDGISFGTFSLAAEDYKVHSHNKGFHLRVLRLEPCLRPFLAEAPSEDLMIGAGGVS